MNTIAASLVANWTASLVFAESMLITAAFVGIFGGVTNAMCVVSPGVA